MQKIKKYADQDEEERQMKLELLGAKKVKGFDQKMAKHKITIQPQQKEEESEQVTALTNGNDQEAT